MHMECTDNILGLLIFPAQQSLAHLLLAALSAAGLRIKFPTKM